MTQDLAMGSLILTTKSTNNKRKKKLNFLKINNFCSLKDFIKNVKKPTEREKIFPNHKTVKNLRFRIYKNTCHSTTKRPTAQLKYRQST